MKRSPRTSTSREAIVAAYLRLRKLSTVANQAKDHLNYYESYRQYPETLSADSGVATWSGRLKLGEALRKAVAEPCKLGRNDDASLELPVTNLHHTSFLIVSLL
jgi:hypothetical protein